MNKSNIDNVAENAANIEKIFNDTFGYELNNGDYGVDDPITIHSTEYKILADYDFNRSGIDFYQKAVVLQNVETGEVYFHFNGTGDGNWGYNAAAYGAEPQPSNMQRGCLLWFDTTMEKLKADGIINDSSSVYVTGHSQGGNNAMFVTMRSKYGNDIDVCVPLDGPDFSNKFVDDTMSMLGKDEYNSRCDKIWAYTGENDYVDFLGQQSIVPDGHTTYVKYSGEGFNFEDYHCANGLINADGKMEFVDSDSAFRQLLNDLVKKVPDLPQEDQVIVANTVMAILENNNGDLEFRTSDLYHEDLKRTFEILTPLLADLLKDHPDEIGTVLVENLNFDPRVASAIVGVIEQYGKLDQTDREAFLAAVFDLIKVKDNNISFDLTKLAESYDVLSDALDKMIFSDPNAMRNLLNDLDVTSDPIQFVIIVSAVVLWDGFVDPALDIITEIVDIAVTVINTLNDFAESVKEVFVSIIEGVRSIVNGIKAWWREKTNKGIKYVKDNPYFSVDTEKLREYARRLNTVNYRLSELDTEMHGLYKQAGLLDIWDILCCNLIISPSYSLKSAEIYLNNTADRLEMADNKAKGYMGG